MKISCQSCQAKYTIADEKVLGKIVKIRCKKCSATIVINGNDAGATQQSGDNVFDYTAQGSAEQWTVNVADGDQRNVTSDEIVEAYRAGVVTDETYCWKDGMADWLPLREIQELVGAIASAKSPSFAPAPVEHEADDQVTRIQESNVGASYGAAQAGGANGNPVFAPAAQAPQPGAAARRAGGRANPAADLFGTAQKAGGEEDVMTSAPSSFPAPQAHPDIGGKLTGQRNENSVLFSLNALTGGPPGGMTKQEEASRIPLATGEGSGLIDIRALAANVSQKQSSPPKPNRIDDIMNLGGGGAFTQPLTSAALTAPAAAPVLEAPDLSSAASSAMEDQQADKKRKMLLAAIIGGCGLAAVAIIVIVIAVASKSDDSGAAGAGSATATAATTSAAKAPTAATTATAPAPIPSAAAPAASSAAPAASAADPEDPGAAEFDLDAAKAALKAAAKGAGGCGKPGGPTGKGHVLLTYKHDGSPGSVSIKDGGFDGTPVGNCVIAKFQGAKIPKFKGEAPPLEKAFTIE